jgi:hypothetical protein
MDKEIKASINAAMVELDERLKYIKDKPWYNGYKAGLARALEIIAESESKVSK